MRILAATILSWVSSGTKLRRTRRYELRADLARHAQVVTGVLRNAADRLINAVAARR